VWTAKHLPDSVKCQNKRNTDSQMPQNGTRSERAALGCCVPSRVCDGKFAIVAERDAVNPSSTRQPALCGLSAFSCQSIGTVAPHSAPCIGTPFAELASGNFAALLFSVWLFHASIAVHGVRSAHLLEPISDAADWWSVNQTMTFVLSLAGDVSAM
jgi:hypothetical protein